MDLTTTIPPDASVIYVIRHVDSRRVYVGSSTRPASRWKEHTRALRRGVRHSRYLQRAWKKYGAGAFCFEIIEIVDDESSLLAREQFYIDDLKAADSTFGFNIGPVAGSPRGIVRTAETRARISAAVRARPQSWRDGLAAYRHGRALGPCPTERKAKISAANKGRRPSAHAIEKAAAVHRGAQASEGTREKMRLSQRQRRATERAARPEVPDTRAWRWVSDADFCRAVESYQAGASMREAGEAVGLSKAALSSRMKRHGIPARRSARVA